MMKNWAMHLLIQDWTTVISFFIELFFEKPVGCSQAAGGVVHGFFHSGMNCKREWDREKTH